MLNVGTKIFGKVLDKHGWRNPIISFVVSFVEMIVMRDLENLTL